MSDVNSLYAGTYSNTTGLVLWLKRDEGSGEICADSSGEGDNGTIVGASWSTYVEPTPTPTPSPKPIPNLIAVVGVAIILMMIVLYSYYSLK